MTFNLIHESWVPCRMNDGMVHELGIQAALARAPDISELTHSSPLVTFALHRLLLAILHRNFGPEDSSEWKKLWDSGSWDHETLATYFERWKSRFDLFGSTHPFYQDASLDFQYAVPISKLAHELASGNNPTLFDHSIDQALVGVAPAMAARWLVAHQGFAVGGLVSLEKGQNPKLFKSADAAPLAKGAFALLKGRNLFETLMLNLHGYSASGGVPFDFEAQKDTPAWERNAQIQARDRLPHGYLDLLTWQSRRMRLHPEVDCSGHILIRGVVIMKGNQFPDGFSRYDRETMLAFQSNPKAKVGQDPWPALALREDRALWRDSLSLFETVRPNQTQERPGTRPKTLDWVNDLAREGKLDRKSAVPLDLIGLCTDRAKVLFWRHERLPLPLEYLDDKALLDKLKHALNLCEDAAGALRMSARELARFLLAPNCDQRDAPKPNPDEVKSLASSIAIERRYWPALEAPFSQLLVRLAGDRTIDADHEPIYGRNALPQWAETIRRAAARALDETLLDLNTSGRSFKAAARGRREFYLRFGRAIAPYRTMEVSDAQNQST